jgi:hypothetical protein
MPSHTDAIVLKHRPGPELRPNDLVPERRPLRAPGPARSWCNNVISVDPYQLRMLRGSHEIPPVAIGEPIPATASGSSRNPRTPACR